jgi:hypothetical protein
MANVFYPGTLLLGANEIRLVKLLPGHWGDEIRCKLLYDPLWSIRPYHSLSYVWGSPRITRPILLDGYVFPVTVNLESALRHLRHQLRDTFLWIDALCINQSDNQERTRQVQLMGKIYRLSKSVLVYLGDGIGRQKPISRSKISTSAPPITVFFDDDRDIPQIEGFMQATPVEKLPGTNKKELGREMEDTIKVFSFIRTLSWVNHLTDLPLFASKNDDQDVQGDLLHLFETLRQLMHAPYTPWWGRIWVVQEVILPPEVTVICGTVSAPWRMFSRAASHYLHHIHHCCFECAENLPRDYLHVLKDFCQRVLDIEDLRSTYLEKATNPERVEAGSIISEAHNGRTEQRSLISLLRRFRSRKSSDPRDKVFALLSLVQHSSYQTVMLPDYSLSEPEVYRRAALESIYSSGSLSVLNADLARKFRQDLPTWVPDWEAPGDFTHNARMEAIGLYDVCANDPVNPKTVKAHGHEVLSLIGRYMDTVVSIGEVMLSDSSHAFRETLISWIYLKRGHSGVTRFEGTDLMLWRIFCADVLCYRQTTSTRDTFRRVEVEDELKFVTWALLSKRSPFYKSKIPLANYISEFARPWQRLLEFETSILTGEMGQVFSNFEALYPDGTERRSLIMDAYDHAEISDDKFGEQLKKIELIEYATLSDREIEEIEWQNYITKQADQGTAVIGALTKADDDALTLRSRRSQERARKQIPWSEVLKIVRSDQEKKLGNASDIGPISNDILVSIMDHSIVSATKARRLFITKQGYIGLGPADLKTGDDLFLLRGGRTPFFLRRNASGHFTRGLRVVGDCYACGLMDSSKVEKYPTPLEEWELIELV